VIVLQDRVYAQPKGIPLHFDFVRPPGEETCPLVVACHGGGWISGCKEDMRDVARLLAHAGYAVASPQYRLAPLHPYPAAIEDVQAFVRYVRSHAVELGVHPERVASLGISAGGHLAAMLGVTNPPAPEGEPRELRSQVNAVVAICPITDIAHPRELQNEISVGFVEQFMGGPFLGNEQRYREASPLHHVTPDDPPFLIVHGEADEIVPVVQSDELASKLEHNGVSVKYIRLPGEGHGFSLPAFELIMQESLAFLKENL